MPIASKDGKQDCTISTQNAGDYCLKMYKGPLGVLYKTNAVTAHDRLRFFVHVWLTMLAFCTYLGR